MDMLYSRYSSPMDLIKRYIKQGRFGAFVQSFIEAEAERRKQVAEKENESKLWLAYVFHGDGKTYDEWKKQVTRHSTTKKAGKRDADLNDDGIKSIMDKFLN